MATKYKPFLFDRRFDEEADSDPYAGDAETAERAANDAAGEAEAAEPEPEPPPPTYSEAELAEARRAAHEEGRREGLEAGRAEAREDIDAQAAEALEAVAGGLAPLAERQRENAERHAALTVRIVRDIFARLMPVYVRRHGDDEVTGLVTECLASLQDVDRLTVRVAEPAAERLRERLEPAARGAGFEGRLAVVPDPAMARGDAALDWSTGGAERRYADIWAEIETAVARAAQAVEPDGDEPAATGPAEPDPAEPAEAGPAESEPTETGPADETPAEDAADGAAAGAAADAPARER